MFRYLHAFDIISDDRRATEENNQALRRWDINLVMDKAHKRERDGKLFPSWLLAPETDKWSAGLVQKQPPTQATDYYPTIQPTFHAGSGATL